MWLDSDCVRVVFTYLWPQCPVKNTTPNHSFEFVEGYEIFCNDNKLHIVFSSFCTFYYFSRNAAICSELDMYNSPFIKILTLKKLLGGSSV